jgi:ribonuclease E
MTEPVVDGPPGNDDATSNVPRPSEAPSEVQRASEAPSDVRSSDAASEDTATSEAARAKRRRGSRGGRNRSRPGGDPADASGPEGDQEHAGGLTAASPTSGASRASADAGLDESGRERSATPVVSRSRPSTADGASTGSDPGDAPAGPATAADTAAAPAAKPKIGDSRPAPTAPANERDGDGDGASGPKAGGNRRRRGGRGRSGSSGGGEGGQGQGGGRAGDGTSDDAGRSEPRSGQGRNAKRGDGRSGNGGNGGGGNGGGRRGGRPPQPVEAVLASEPLEIDDDELRRRGGRERKGRPVGRYLMAVSVGPKATQIAVLEGRNLIEHYVSRPADDVSQIHGNIYLGRVQNVLPGMEAAFIDISTPKNAVLYRGDVQHDPDDVDEKVSQQARIEDILKPKQTIICQVTKNPIAHKGARLTQEVSLPGRFVVLIPNSTTYGISKRLPDDERKRLRGILDKVRPKGHGLIVRTAAAGVTATEIERDVLSLSAQWDQIAALAAKTQAPALLYREPDMAVRVIREELNEDYRAIVIDEPKLFEEIRSYVNAISPALADRVQYYDKTVEPLSIYERHHIHEQIHKALDRKVWLPSGGSLIIEHTEALTVIDVNTGKNVGSSNLEETVFRNNLEAAIEIAKQLRLRDIGGIIVIDFIDMEIDKNRKAVIKAFREALARDKTRTQAFDITDLGLVEMTRKRIGEGLLESFATTCPECEGRGIILDQDLLV